MPTHNMAFAYAGTYQNPVTGGYLLGLGYRTYLPELMRFIAPDDWSPFGSGGINAYAYCAGDPINRVDPSGHFGVGALLFAAFNVLMLVPDAIPGLDEISVPLQVAVDAGTLAEESADVAVGAAEASAAAARAVDEGAASSRGTVSASRSILSRGARNRPWQTVRFADGTAEAPEKPTATFRSSSSDRSRYWAVQNERALNRMDWERAPERQPTFEERLTDAEIHLDRVEFQKDALLPSRRPKLFSNAFDQLRGADKALAQARGIRARFERPGPSMASLTEYDRIMSRYSTLKQEVFTLEKELYKDPLTGEPFAFTRPAYEDMSSEEEG